MTEDEEPGVPAEDPQPDAEPKVNIAQLYALHYHAIMEALGALGHTPTNNIDRINWRIALANVAKDLTIYELDAQRVIE